MISFVEYLNAPARIAICIVGIFFVLQIIGELLEFKGKVVPEFVKVRKYFARKKTEKLETAQTLKEVKTLLNYVSSHYSEDNIDRRNRWMQ